MSPPDLSPEPHGSHLRNGYAVPGIVLAFVALATGCALGACASTSDSQVIFVPTGDGRVQAQTVFTGASSEQGYRAELREADLPSSWLCQNHPALVQRLSRHPVAKCRSYAYVVEFGRRRETMHDLVIETTEEVAEQNGILFRLVDPIADIFIDKTGKAAGLLRFESVTAGPETFFVINSFREED